MRLRGLLAVLAVVGTVAAPASAQTNRPELVEVSFVGNRVVPTDTLQKIIQNKATNCRSMFFTPVCWFTDALKERRYFAPNQVRLDSLRVLAYYRLIGYRDATVDTSLTQRPEGVALGFDIEEGQPVRVDSIDIRVYDQPLVENLLANLPIRVGDPFSALLLEAARDSLTARLLDSGYRYAEVLRSSFIPSEDPYSATVNFEVDPGPRVRFGDIFVQGNEELSAASIEQVLPFRRGQLFRPRMIEEAQRNVFSIPLIRNANVEAIDLDPEALDTIIPLRILVAEGDKHRVREEYGWSTSACLNAAAAWTSRNFFGGARRLTVSAGVSNILAEQLSSTACYQSGDDAFNDLNGRFSVELVQPTIFSSRNSLSVNAFVERESLPDVFIRQAVGVSIGLTRSLSRRTTATLSYQPQLASLDAADVFFCTSFLICTQNDIGVFAESNWLAPLGLNVALDRSNSVLNPTQGWVAAIDIEHAAAWTGSDFAYNRLAGEIATYLGLGGDVTLALRTRAGVVSEGSFRQLGRTGDGVIHPQKRFFSGGANTVRGFGENRLGPRVLSVDVQRLLETPENGVAACTPDQIFGGMCDPVEINQDRLNPRPTGGATMFGANVELRFPLVGRILQGAVFADIGEVWDQGMPRRFSDVEITPGVGFRYFSPVGPVRIDVGYLSERTELLPVITDGIRPYDPARDRSDARLSFRGADGATTTVDWVTNGGLRVLNQDFDFVSGRSFWRRLQLHFSIGQAF